MTKIKDIVKADLCIGCGVCISESEGSLKMEMDNRGFYVPVQVTDTKTKAVRVCPYNPNPDKEVEDEDKLAEIFLTDTIHKDDRIGSYHNIYVGYSHRFRKTSSSGGIATYILEQLLTQGIVNHLFVVKEVDGKYAYQWFEKAEQIREVSKTRYIPVTLEKLFLEIDQKEGKVAVSGIPPFLKAIRLKQYYNPQYRDKIAFLTGIICGGWKSTFFTDYLAQKSGVEGEYNKQQYRIKDDSSRAIDYSFGVYDTKGQHHQMKMRTVGDMWGSGLFNSNASDFSDDVTAELADISLGDAWIDPYDKDGRGTSLFVTRSLLAEQIIKDGIDKGELQLEELSLDRFKQSQAGAFRHRQMGMKYRLQLLKKKQNIIPHKRERLFENIPFEFKLVQKQRMIVRAKSIEYWQATKDAAKFEEKINPLREKLRKRTRVYHIVQSVKKRMGLKRM